MCVYVCITDNIHTMQAHVIKFTAIGLINLTRPKLSSTSFRLFNMSMRSSACGHLNMTRAQKDK